MQEIKAMNIPIQKEVSEIAFPLIIGEYSQNTIVIPMNLYMNIINLYLDDILYSPFYGNY